MIINRRYKILKKLGEGRSQVFLVTDNYYPNNIFAMKVISCSAAQRELQLFKNEYYLLKSFNHKNIVKAFFNGVVSEIKEDNLFNIQIDDLFFSMEFIDGKIISEVSVDKRIKNYHKIAAQISSVLFYLHQSNLIYYDLKPENIIFCENENSKIKFIDFGFTEEFSRKEISAMKGTPQLISPEILGQKLVDFRTDIYSFGVFLYWLLFDKYPFDSKDELEIYKQHISSKLTFPDNCSFDKHLLDTIIKATAKEQGERFNNSLEFFAEISDGNSVLDSNQFINVYKYFEVTDIGEKIDDFINSKSEYLLEIIGTKNSGKSKILERIKRKVEPAVIIDFADEIDTKEIWRRVIGDLLFLKTIPSEIFKLLSNYFENYFDNPDEKLDELILTFFSRISNDNNFVFLIDNYDKADESSKEILKKLLNMLEINHVKIFITEQNVNEDVSSSVHSKIIINPLSEKQISEFIEYLFYAEYPKKELVTLIQHYSDKYFGSINIFIQGLLQSGIISYSDSKPKINLLNLDQKLLSKDSVKILDSKLLMLDQEDLYVLYIISAFEKIGEDTIIEISDLSREVLGRILTKLEALNIIYERKIYLGIKFIADSYKNYFYDKIDDKKLFHKKIIDKIRDNKSIIAKEKIFHYQMAEEFDSAINLIEDEIQTLESFSAYHGIEKLLYKIISYPIERSRTIEYKIQLLENYLKIGDFLKALELHQSIDIANITAEQNQILDYYKGRILYRLGNNQEALNLFIKLLENCKLQDFENKIKIEQAGIYLAISEFENAKQICTELIENEKIDSDLKAKTLNILALENIYGSNNFQEAARLFTEAIKIYEKNNNKSKLAGVELNLGNVLHILGEANTAFLHWEKAQQLNKKIGNFQQEADSLLSMGVYNFNNFEVDDAIEKYRRANTIYKTIGNKFGAGTSHCNLAECSIFAIDYGQAEIELGNAVKYLNELQNTEENIYVEFLLGVFYLKLDLHEKLFKSINQLELLNNVTNAKLYIDSLKLILMLKENSDIEKINLELERILTELFSQQNLFVIYTILVEVLKISNSNLKREVIKKIIALPLYPKLKENNYIVAIKMTFSSILAQNDSENFKKSDLQYLLQAYEKLKTQTVSELTVIVILDITRIYIENGNVWKAKDFFYYINSLYEFIKETLVKTTIAYEESSIDLMKKLKNFILEHKQRMN